MNPGIHLDQFTHMVDFHDSYITDEYDINYPGIIMKITLKRNLGYHILQTFIPSTLFVILGYLSLYIPPDAVPGRVAMGMTTILTLTAMFSGVRQHVPEVSYISYLDMWMVMCLIFVNLFMFEFVLVIYHIKSLKKEKAGRLLERKGRIVFPFLFIMFNVLYWPAVNNIWNEEINLTQSDTKSSFYMISWCSIVSKVTNIFCKQVTSIAS